LIRNAEHAAAMDIKQANRLWTIKKKKFEKLTMNNTMKIKVSAKASAAFSIATTLRSWQNREEYRL
jgi:hypothetical protein